MVVVLHDEERSIRIKIEHLKEAGARGAIRRDKISSALKGNAGTADIAEAVANILKLGEGHPRGIDREGVFRGGVSLTVKGHRIPYRGVSDGVKGHPIRCPRMPFRGVSVTPLMMGVITPRYFDF